MGNNINKQEPINSSHLVFEFRFGLIWVPTKNKVKLIHHANNCFINNCGANEEIISMLRQKNIVSDDNTGNNRWLNNIYALFMVRISPFIIETANVLLSISDSKDTGQLGAMIFILSLTSKP